MTKQNPFELLDNLADALETADSEHRKLTEQEMLDAIGETRQSIRMKIPEAFADLRDA